MALADERRDGEEGMKMVSVIIVNWNGADVLPACLRAVRKVAARAPLELIVVDNASTDGSADSVAEEYASARLVRNEGNVGFVAANNQALAYATGSHVLFLNPDTEMSPDALGMMLDCLEASPAVGVVGPLLLNSDGSPQESYFRFPGFRSVFLEHLFVPGLARRRGVPRRLSGGPFRVDVVRGACMLVRTEEIRSVGGFNPHIFMYAEETDLCRKFRRRGLVAMCCPAARVIHHEARSMVRQAPRFVLYHYSRSACVYFMDNETHRRARILIFMVLLGLRIRGAVATMLGKGEQAGKFLGVARAVDLELRPMMQGEGR